MTLTAASVALLLVGASCRTEPSGASCDVGRVETCVCESGASGARSCMDDRRWSACLCGVPVDGGFDDAWRDGGAPFEERMDGGDPMDARDGAMTNDDGVDAVVREAGTDDVGDVVDAAEPFVSGWDPRIGPLGLDQPAVSLLVDGSTVVLGGRFRHVRGESANLLARFDPATGAFTPVPNTLRGLSPSANAITRWQGSLVVGGSFVGGIASQSGGDFAVLGGGLETPGFVFALVPDSARLWVGGNFVTSDHQSAHVAAWTAGGWQSLGDEPDRVVLALARDGNTLWIGGDFVFQAGTPPLDLFGIGRFDLGVNRWTSVGAGATAGSGTAGRATVSAIVSTPDFIYAGGDFDRMDGRAVGRIARWRRATARWEALPPGVGVRGAVQAMAYDAGKLYVAGLFNQAGGVAAANIAVFDTARESWSTLGDGVDGTVSGTGPTQVVDIAVSGRDIYVAGDFANAGGRPSPGFAHYRMP